MTKILIGLLLISAGLTSWANDKSIMRVKLDYSLLRQLRHQGYDVLGVNIPEKHFEILVSKEEQEQLKLSKSMVIHSFPSQLMRGPDEEYLNPSEIDEMLKEMNQRYPELTQLVEVGKTLEGRTIMAIKISDNAKENEIGEPAILFNSMHHAREVMTPEVAADIIDYLLSHYGSDEKVTNWVDNSAIYIIPMFNLDGNQKMWDDDSMWRKNTRGGHGVDINRNYPATWNTCNGSSGSRWAQDYRGASAGSEPETQAMMSFVGKIKPVFSISYHSYSEIVIYPFGCNPQRTPNRDLVEGLGKQLGEKIGYKAGTAWELLYDVDGGDIDWMYKAHQVIPYVIEVNSTSEGFHPDYKQWRDKTVVRNRAGWQMLLDRLHGSAIIGHKGEKTELSTVTVYDAKMNKIDDYSLKNDGSFHIIVNPGTYEVHLKDMKGNILEKKNVQVGTEKVRI